MRTQPRFASPESPESPDPCRPTVEEQSERVAWLMRTEWTDFARLVRCVQRPEWGAVAVEWVAQQIGAGGGTVASGIRCGHAVHGHRFYWDGDPPARRSHSSERRVRCVETGQVYPSVVDATRAIGHGRSAVSEALRTGYAAAGLHFEYVV